MSSSIYADEGTGAHALAAMCLQENTHPAGYIGRRLECEDYEHAGLSPSSADRWMECPGSLAMEAREAFKPRKFTVEVDVEMAGAVNIYVQAIRRYATGGELLVEQKLPVGHITGEDGATGSGDAIVILPDELQAHDLKFGKGVRVSAVKNKQGMLYLLGTIELLTPLGYDFKKFRFRFVIHQPRISSTPDEWSCTLDELLAFAEEVKARAGDALTAYAYRENWLGKSEDYLNPGEKACMWCDAKATCPALARRIAEGVGASFDVLGDEATEHAKKLGEAPTVAAVKALDVTTGDGVGALAEKMRAVDLIEDWCRAVRAKVESVLLGGGVVPGFKLVTGRAGPRRWSDPIAVETLLKGMRLKKDQMYDFALKSPTQILDVVLKGQERRVNSLTPLVTRNDGKPSVAPVSDKRPAIDVKPVADSFSDVTAADLV